MTIDDSSPRCNESPFGRARFCFSLPASRTWSVFPGEYKRVSIDLRIGNCTGKNKPIDEFDFIVPVAPEISMDEMFVPYMEYLEKYCAFEPRLRTAGADRVLTALSECTAEMQARCCVHTG